MVNRDDVSYAAAAGVTSAKNTSAISNGDDQFRVGDSSIGALERFLHVGGDRASDEQQVSVSGTGDKLDSRAFQVVVRIMERLDL